MDLGLSDKKMLKVKAVGRESVPGVLGEWIYLSGCCPHLLPL